MNECGRVDRLLSRHAQAPCVGSAVAQAEQQVPTVEWWDAFYLARDVYPSATDGEAGAMVVDGAADSYRREIVTHLVQHPIPTVPPREEAPVKPKEMYLTKEVRRRPASCRCGQVSAPLPDRRIGVWAWASPAARRLGVAGAQKIAPATQPRSGKGKAGKNPVDPLLYLPKIAGLFGLYGFYYFINCF